MLSGVLGPCILCSLQWERLRAEREAEELRDCTFRPALLASPPRAAARHTPLHCRLVELQRNRRHVSACMDFESP